MYKTQYDQIQLFKIKKVMLLNTCSVFWLKKNCQFREKIRVMYIKLNKVFTNRGLL